MYQAPNPSTHVWASLREAKGLSGWPRRYFIVRKSAAAKGLSPITAGC